MVTIGGWAELVKGWVKAYFWSGISGLPFYFLAVYLVRKKAVHLLVCISTGVLDSRHGVSFLQIASKKGN